MRSLKRSKQMSMKLALTGALKKKKAKQAKVDPPNVPNDSDIEVVSSDEEKSDDDL